MRGLRRPALRAAARFGGALGIRWRRCVAVRRPLPRGLLLIMNFAFSATCGMTIGEVMANDETALANPRQLRARGRTPYRRCPSGCLHAPGRDSRISTSLPSRASRCQMLAPSRSRGSTKTCIERRYGPAGRRPRPTHRHSQKTESERTACRATAGGRRSRAGSCRL